jgi:hypothetical protein
MSPAGWHVDSSGHRRVVLLAVAGDATNAVYQALAARFEVVGVVLERPISRRTLVLGRARRIGWLRTLDQVLFITVVSPLLRRSSRDRLASLRTNVRADEPVPPDLVAPVPSVNDPATVATLARLEPDVVVVVGTRIIRDSVLTEADVPFVNMHAGITPRYRGVHGAYWAMAEGRPASAGVTVHLVDPGIDTGPILAQARIVATRADTFATLPYLQLAAGIPILVAAIAAVLEGRMEPVPSFDASASMLWYHPGAFEYLVRRIRRAVR